jgi:hypothetical protein
MTYLDSYDNDNESDSIHEENETATKGAYHVKKKHGRTVDHTTVSANPVDADLLADLATVPEQEQIEVRRGKKAEDDEEREPELPRAVAPAIVKQQNKERLAAAQADFKLPKLPKEASNDNFKPVVSWPLMDQLTRSTFEPDKERRTKMIVRARYIRDLIDLAGADALGNDNDCEVQRTESGKVFFEHGQTLDRKKRTYDSRNGEQGADRHDGPIRTATKSLPVGNGGFDCDDPFPVRLIAAREELGAIIAAVGPLWPSLFAAVSENATMTEIGLALGAKSALSPPFGSLIIRLALTAAMEALDRFNGIKDEPRRTTPLPDKARGGSYWNQASGPVMKVAA